MDRVDYWNHHVHYQLFIFRTIPPACGQALDAGCGDGMLACRLAVIGLAADGSAADVLAEVPASSSIGTTVPFTVRQTREHRSWPPI
jgi:hypothetical protein